ncbi:hypothetical protein [Aurantiacibacter hainanensis]|uniref:hypothetical protein n=1 Tax=Aurantiacibacter hainanensis TaxID=3076114 RepID=UPI0030C69A4B
MDQNTLIAILVVVALVIAIAIWLFFSRRRTDHLRDRFGEEYDRTLDNSGDRTAAERALEEREKRVDALDIRPLTAEEHSRFEEEWRDVKGVFVDSPAEAVLHADRMLANMMKTVGYPMADFDHRYEDLTVDHPDVARHYREGHAIAERHGSGNASTEDMRQAMKHYEALYDHLASNRERDTVSQGEYAGASTRDAPASTGATTRTTDVDGDGDADIVRRDLDGDGHAETTRAKTD